MPNSRLGTINFILKNTNKIAKNLNRGINDGKKLYNWIESIVEKKLDNKEATFLDLKKKNPGEISATSESFSQQDFEYKNLLVIVTNALKKQTEVFSWETTPHLRIADAILASMSIPGFFYVRYIDKDKRKIDWNPTQKKLSAGEIIPYVDGGVLNNYPIDLVQDYKYWPREYYGLVKFPRFNPSALGVRVDSKEEVLELIDNRRLEMIAMQHEDQGKEPAAQRMDSPCDLLVSPSQVKDVIKNFITLLLADINKVKQYYQCTIAIPDGNIKTIQFGLTKAEKDKLKKNGKVSAKGFLGESPKEKSFKEITYANRAELEEDIKTKDGLIEGYDKLKDGASYAFESSRLKLENKHAKEKHSELGKKDSSKFFQDYVEPSTSRIQQTIDLGEVITRQEFTETVEEVPKAEGFSKPEEASGFLRVGDENSKEHGRSFSRKLCCW